MGMNTRADTLIRGQRTYERGAKMAVDFTVVDGAVRAVHSV